MTTTKTEPKPRLANWERPEMFGTPPETFKWPALEALQKEHAAACEKLAAAREDGDAKAIREAHLALIDIVGDGLAELRRTLGKAEADYMAARHEQIPSHTDPEHPLPLRDRDAYRELIATIRPAFEHDEVLVRKVKQGWLAADHFWPPGSGCLVPNLVARTEAARENLEGS
jgi:hypothetical protein